MRRQAAKRRAGQLTAYASLMMRTRSGTSAATASVTLTALLALGVVDAGADTGDVAVSTVVAMCRGCRAKRVALHTPATATTRVCGSVPLAQCQRGNQWYGQTFSDKRTTGRHKHARAHSRTRTHTHAP
jgi:hypothetical protein